MKENQADTAPETRSQGPETGGGHETAAALGRTATSSSAQVEDSTQRAAGAAALSDTVESPQD